MRNSSVTFEQTKPFFATLGNETRFEIVRLVTKKPRTVSEICEALDCKQTKISNDLKCLRECGYVHVEKNGNERIYSIDKNIAPVLSSITKQLQKLRRVCDGCKTCRADKNIKVGKNYRKRQNRSS